jgi:hypothetical protein
MQGGKSLQIGALYIGRFQVSGVSDSGDAVLVDTETGKSWRLAGNGWVPIPFKGDAPAAPEK